MNSLIFDQLNKVKKAKLPQFDINTTHLKIKATKEDLSAPINLAVGKAYLIKLASYIIDPPAGFNLHANWNKGKIPQSNFLYALVIQDIGKMVKVDSYEYDYKNQYILSRKWTGWLPKKSIEVIKEVIWKV